MVARRRAEQGRDLLERQRNQQMAAAFDTHTQFVENTYQLIGSAMLAIGKMGTDLKAARVTQDKRHAAEADFTALSAVLQRIEVGRLDSFESIDALCFAEA